MARISAKIRTISLNKNALGRLILRGNKIPTSMYPKSTKNAAKIKVGSLVSGDSHVTCGRCYQCRIGENHVCLNEAILGISIDGIFAEYVKIAKDRIDKAVNGELSTRPMGRPVFDPKDAGAYLTTAPWDQASLRQQRLFQKSKNYST